MTAYAVGNLTQVEMGPDIVDYLKGIDATLAPFGGRFLVHGGPVEKLEGHWAGNLIVIAFPDMARAKGWYDSDAYQTILPLRTRNSTGHVILVNGVKEGHRATDVIPPRFCQT